MDAWAATATVAPLGCQLSALDIARQAAIEMATPPIHGVYSGSWGLSPPDSNHASATPAVTADGTTAVRLATHTAGAGPTGVPPPASLTLLDDQGNNAVANPFWTYGVRFDFLRDAAHFAAGAFTLRNDVYWGVEFVAGSDSVQVTHQLQGKMAVIANGDLTFGGKYKAAETWYRVEIRNTDANVQCRVTVRNSGGQPGAFDEHPGDPVATAKDPNSSGDVILDVTAPHDNPAKVANQRLVFTADGADLAGLVSNVFATWPLHSLAAPTPEAGLPPIARTLASSSAAGLVATVGPSGHVYLRRDAPADAPPLGFVNVAAELQQSTTRQMTSVPVLILSTESGSAAGHFLQTWKIGDAVGERFLLQLDFQLVDAPAIRNGDAWSSAPAEGYLECTVSSRRDPRDCLESASPAAEQLRVTTSFQPTTAAFVRTPASINLLRFQATGSLLSWPVDVPLDPLFPACRAAFGTLHHQWTETEIPMISQRGTVDGTRLLNGCFQWWQCPTWAYPRPVQTYIPMIGLYEDGSNTPGLLLSADPRVAFTFEAGLAGLSASRLFFIGTTTGTATDSGFNNGDVDVKYTLRFALPSRSKCTAPGQGTQLPEKVEWGRVFHQHYCAANRFLSAGPSLDHGVFCGGVPTSQADLKRFTDNKTSIITSGYFFGPESNVIALLPGVRIAQRAGIKALLWSNIRQAIDCSKHPEDDPATDYNNFKDSWVLEADGKTKIRCWDGYSCNPAAGSFGPWEFQRLTTWVTKHNLDGIFLDCYGDSIDSDHGRAYAQFPFFPLQVAETIFIKQLFTWCEKNGKILNLNSPHMSLPVLHLCHSVTADSEGPNGHWSLVDRLVTMAAGKRHLLLPSALNPKGAVAALPSSYWLQNGCRSLFFGEVPTPFNDSLDCLVLESCTIWSAYQGSCSAEQVPCPWYAYAGSGAWPQDWQTMEFLAQSNAALALLLGMAQLVGGECFDSLWWVCPANAQRGAVGFITLANDLNPATERTLNPPTVTHTTVTLARYIQLAAGLQYQALFWDGVASLSTLTPAMDGAALSSRQLDVALGPGETKLLCFAPLATAAELLRWTSDDRNTACDDKQTPCGGCAAADVGERKEETRRELQWRTIALSAIGLCVALLWGLLSAMMLAPRSSSCSQED